MKTKGSYEYGEDAEKIVLSYVSDIPRTSNDIKNRLRENVFSKIERETVKRLLENLYKKGMVKKQPACGFVLWSK